MSSDGLGIQSQFNQASYLMRRIDDLESRLDRLATNPLAKFEEACGLYNFEAMLNDLGSLLSAISPKLTKDEINECKTLRKEVKKQISKNNLYKNIGLGSRSNWQLNPRSFPPVAEALFDLRLKIESLIDMKGVGNPNKKSPSAAVIN